MEEFVIQSGREDRLIFHSRRIALNHWVESYMVTLEGRNFHASIEAQNPPYGISPAEFFELVAESWTGWKGAKKWSAMEDEYNLFATCDEQGHATVAAEITPTHKSPSWSSRLLLFVEKAQLDRIARDAKVFFNEA